MPPQPYHMQASPLVVINNSSPQTDDPHMQCAFEGCRNVRVARCHWELGCFQHGGCGRNICYHHKSHEQFHVHRDNHHGHHGHHDVYIPTACVNCSDHLHESIKSCKRKRCILHLVWLLIVVSLILTFSLEI